MNIACGLYVYPPPRFARRGVTRLCPLRLCLDSDALSSSDLLIIIIGVPSRRDTISIDPHHEYHRSVGVPSCR